MSISDESRQTLTEIEEIVERLKQKFSDRPEEVLGNPSPEVLNQIKQAIDLAETLPSIDPPKL